MTVSQSYSIVYHFVNELPERIRKYVYDKATTEGDSRKLYLFEVSKELRMRAGSYGPMDGSVYEDLRRKLNNLSDEFLLRA